MNIGIYGYGNLGRGVEAAIAQNPDMQLVAVFTRRDPKTLKIETESATVVHTSDVLSWKDKIDVMILCGGSATDLPKQSPLYAEYFNIVDSFDKLGAKHKHSYVCKVKAIFYFIRRISVIHRNYQSARL